MITNEERREVARRMRELESYSFDDGEYIDCGEVEEALGLVNDDGAWYKADGVMRLADLIEPSGYECVPGECPLNVRHDNDGIDRDALLKLADEMDAHWVGHEGMEDSPVARWSCHIRESLGE